MYFGTTFWYKWKQKIYILITIKLILQMKTKVYKLQMYIWKPQNQSNFRICESEIVENQIINQSTQEIKVTQRVTRISTST